MFGVRHDSSCFSSCLLWALLLSDSIIFQMQNQLEKPPIINVLRFLKPQAEKSFNRKRTEKQLKT